MPSGFKRAFVTPLDVINLSDKEGVGTIRFEGNKVYKYVQLLNTTATVAVVAGDAVAYFAEVGHNTSRVVSDVSDADTVIVGAGIVGATIAGVLLTSYYVWIQIKGPATVAQTIAGTPVDGDQLQMDGADKALTKQLFAGTTPDIAAAGSYMGIATDASAKLVALECPF